MRLKIVPVSAILCGVAGCMSAGGDFLPGTITAQDGRQLQFEIERSRGAGAVKALDLRTHEQFAGKYVAIRETVSGATNAVITSGSSSGLGFEHRAASSNIANANAFLTGDMGSSLTCNMQIQAAWSPHGIGSCVDQKAVNYQLQF
jgi:hypothetical protein